MARRDRKRSRRETATRGAPAPHPLLAQPLPSLRAEWPLPLAVFLFALAVYATSMPRTVTLEDSGLFLMSCHAAGISHPPGYPLHSLLGKLFTLLPVGSVAACVHLLSATFGGLTAAVLWWISRVLTGERVAALSAALAFVVSREMWAQSIIAEVYSLNTFLFFLLFAACLAYRIDGEPRRLRWAAALFGLALSNHWPLIVLSTPALAVLLAPRWRSVVPLLPRLVPLLAAGLLPYVYMVVRSRMDPPISWIGPLDSAGRVLHLILRKGYAGADNSPSANLDDKLEFLGYFVGQAAIQFTLPGALLSIAGAWALWRRAPREVSAALAATFVGNSLLLIVLLKRDFTTIERAVFKVYPLAAYGVMAVAVAAGFARIGGRRAVGAALGFALVVGTFLAHAPTNDRRDYTWARDYARTLLEALPPNAVLFTHADVETGAVGYLHHVEGVRPDVTLYNDIGVVFSNRLFRVPASRETKAAALTDFVRKTDRPVFTTGDLEVPWGLETNVLFRRVEKNGESVFGPTQIDYCRRLAQETDVSDVWTVDHRGRVLANCGHVLAWMHHKNGDPEIGRALDDVTGSFAGNVARIFELRNKVDPAILSGWLDDAAGRLDRHVPDLQLAVYHYLRGLLHARQGDGLAAIADLERSAELDPSRANAALLELLRLRAERNERREYRSTRRRFFGTAPVRDLEATDRQMGL